MCDYRSWAVERYPKESDREKRKELVLKTLKIEKVKEDELLLEAMELYKELIENIHLRALSAARIAMNATIDFLENVDYTLKTKSGGLVYTPKMVLESLNNLEVARSNFEKIEQRIRHSVKDTGKVRGAGGGEIGVFEDPTEEVKAYYGQNDG